MPIKNTTQHENENDYYGDSHRHIIGEEMKENAYLLKILCDIIINYTTYYI